MPFDEFVKQNQHWIGLLGLVIGIVGFGCAVTYRTRLHRVLSQQEQVFFGVLDGMKKMKQTLDKNNTAGAVTDAFDSTHSRVLLFMNMWLNPTVYELDKWVRLGSIDADDRTFLTKVNPRQNG